MPSPPNIVILLADDLGYADVGFHGCKDIQTPNLDALAASGVKCTNGYVTHPFCSPTRAGLMIGRYQQHFGYETNVPYDPQNRRVGLPKSEKTIAKRLQEGGYVTGAIGKWHLGAAEPFCPNLRGFTFFYGFRGGGHDYFQVDLLRPMHEGYFQPLERNGQPEGLDGYLTHELSKEAVRFIEDNSEKPFFLYLAYNAPHGPLQAPEEYLNRFAQIKDTKRRTYAAMVSAMDDGIGRVLGTLRAAGLRERTLVFFLSDNGGPTHANASSNEPLRGYKGDVFEGGIRVPFVASWPGTLPQGTVYEKPVMSLDISRTALAVGRVEPGDNSKLDGVNLLPYFQGEKTEAPHAALFWRAQGGSRWAVRLGAEKLAKASDDEPMMFDLDEDLSEQNDLIGRRPERVEVLLGEFDRWNAKNLPPAFPGYRQYHEEKARFYQDLSVE